MHIPCMWSVVEFSNISYSKHFRVWSILEFGLGCSPIVEPNWANVWWGSFAIYMECLLHSCVTSVATSFWGQNWHLSSTAEGKLREVPCRKESSKGLWIGLNRRARANCWDLQPQKKVGVGDSSWVSNMNVHWSSLHQKDAKEKQQMQVSLLPDPDLLRNPGHKRYIDTGMSVFPKRNTAWEECFHGEIRK